MYSASMSRDELSMERILESWVLPPSTASLLGSASCRISRSAREMRSQRSVCCKSKCAIVWRGIHAAATLDPACPIKGNNNAARQNKDPACAQMSDFASMGIVERGAKTWILKQLC